MRTFRLSEVQFTLRIGHLMCVAAGEDVALPELEDVLLKTGVFEGPGQVFGQSDASKLSQEDKQWWKNYETPLLERIENANKLAEASNLFVEKVYAIEPYRAYRHDGKGPRWTRLQIATCDDAYATFKQQVNAIEAAQEANKPRVREFHEKYFEPHLEALSLTEDQKQEENERQKLGEILQEGTKHLAVHMQAICRDPDVIKAVDALTADATNLLKSTIARLKAVPGYNDPAFADPAGRTKQCKAICVEYWLAKDPLDEG